MIPIAIPPITPPAIAPAIVPLLEVLLLLVFAIELDCVKAPSTMLVAPGTQRETTGPVRVVSSVTIVGATKGGKGGLETGADTEKLVPGGKGESAPSSWVRISASIFRSTLNVALVFVMVIV